MDDTHAVSIHSMPEERMGIRLLLWPKNKSAEKFEGFALVKDCGHLVDHYKLNSQLGRCNFMCALAELGELASEVLGDGDRMQTNAETL